MACPYGVIEYSTMPFLQSSAFLHGTSFSHDSDRDSVASKGNKQNLVLRPKSSLANLIHFVRNPFESASGVVEYWQDGDRKEERTRKQSLEDKKQILYVKLREVRAEGNRLPRPDRIADV